MLVYIGVCSLIGSLSVVTTQGLGTAIVKTIQGENQFTHWFLYVLGAFVVITLLTEVNYLNKALNLFNTAMVTPVYYVVFTSLTIISSAILSQGFEAPPKSVITVVMGFLVICSGIVLLQFSKSPTLESTKSMLISTGDSNLEDNRLSGVDFEPGASEIRSFGGSRRYSLNTKTHPTILPSHTPKREHDDYGHRRSQSLNCGIFRKSTINDGGLPTINESERIIGRKGTTRSLTNPQTVPIAHVDKDTRASTVKFSSSPSSSSSSSSVSTMDDNLNRTQRKTPIIHTTSSSPHSPTIDDKENNDNGFNPLSLAPLPSPLQHPISYINNIYLPPLQFFRKMVQLIVKFIVVLI